MTLATVLRELIDLGADGPPDAARIHAHFAERATDVATGNANLTYPAWARGTRGRRDLFLTLSGPAKGVAIWDDARGWGAYAELAVVDGTLGEIEAVVGPTSPMARNPDDFHSGPRVAAYVQRAQKTIRVFTELEHDGPGVRRVTVHFQR